MRNYIIAVACSLIPFFIGFYSIANTSIIATIGLGWTVVMQTGPGTYSNIFIALFIDYRVFFTPGDWPGFFVSPTELAGKTAENLVKAVFSNAMTGQDALIGFQGFLFLTSSILSIIAIYYILENNKLGLKLLLGTIILEILALILFIFVAYDSGAYQGIIVLPIRLLVLIILFYSKRK